MEDGGCRAGHHHRRWTSCPGDGQDATPGLHRDPRIEQPEPDPGHHGGACPRSARQGLAHAPLIDPQTDPGAVKHLHKPDVDPLGKPRTGLHLGPEQRHRRSLGIGHLQHGMGVAHRHKCYQYRSVMPLIFKGQGPISPRALSLEHQSRRIKRKVLRVKARRPHVDRDAAIGAQTRCDDTALGLHPNGFPGGKAPLDDKPGKAARAIAALLHLLPVSVMDQVFEIDARPGRGPHRQDLVCTDPEMPVAQQAVVGGREPEAFAGLVDHDKVVASTLHFGERDSHGHDYRPVARWHASFGCKMPAMARPSQILDALTAAGPGAVLPAPADWQTATPVALLKNVLRLTAPNPGVMTGPGTNSYLVGDVRTGFIAIDPGPADADHVARLWAAATHPDGSGGNLALIVCTHSHADHSPGAAPLQALCAQSGTTVPVLGLASAATARANSHFVPDATLEHGQRLVLSPAEPGASECHTLQAIHTPGHAANHVCLLLEEDGLLFSGDHILNGSTTVIDPPDGNMGHYLDSLDVLHQACTAHAVQFILPAHGHAMPDALGAIAQLKAHRLRREAKIAAVMHANPDGDPDQWLPLAYDDVHPRLWPVAKRSLLAHVEHIQWLQSAGRVA